MRGRRRVRIAKKRRLEIGNPIEGMIRSIFRARHEVKVTDDNEQEALVEKSCKSEDVSEEEVWEAFYDRQGLSGKPSSGDALILRGASLMLAGQPWIFRAHSPRLSFNLFFSTVFSVSILHHDNFLSTML